MATKKHSSKIKKLFKKRIYLSKALGFMILMLGIISLCLCIVKRISTNDYFYEDIYNNRGHSSNCYEEDGKLYCEATVQVNWYMED